MLSSGVIPFRRRSFLGVFCKILSFLCSALFCHRPHYGSALQLICKWHIIHLDLVLEQKCRGQNRASISCQLVWPPPQGCSASPGPRKLPGWWTGELHEEGFLCTPHSSLLQDSEATGRLENSQGAAGGVRSVTNIFHTGTEPPMHGTTRDFPSVSFSLGLRTLCVKA